MKNLAHLKLVASALSISLTLSACTSAPMGERKIAYANDIPQDQINQYYDSSAPVLLKLITANTARLTADEQKAAIAAIQKRYSKAYNRSFTIVGGTLLLTSIVSGIMDQGGVGGGGDFAALVSSIAGIIVVVGSSSASSGSASVTKSIDGKHERDMKSALAKDAEFNQDIERRAVFFKKVFSLNDAKTREVKDALIKQVTQELLNYDPDYKKMPDPAKGTAMLTDLEGIRKVLSSEKGLMTDNQIRLMDELIAGQKYTREKKEITNFMPTAGHLRQNLEYLRIASIAVEYLMPKLSAPDKVRAAQSLKEAKAEIVKLELILAQSG